MHIGKTSSSDPKKYPPGSFKGRLRERKIVATLAAFAGSGVVIIEVAHHILVNHYHLPHQIVDICIVTLVGALLGTLIWRWFRGVEKRPGNVKVEVLVVPLIILLTVVVDLKLIFSMSGISINMLLVEIVALCLGIAWIVFKSLQWAASVPEAERRAGALTPTKEKPISFPEWKKSIVVLPFDNISSEEGQDYFCNGMTEEIITDLSNIHDLRVISRSSAMMLKGSKKAIRDIANELDVQYVLEGSVRKAGKDIRITAQLIDATSDAHLWADKYGGTMDDVFDIQEKVSRSIVDALKLKLSPEEKKRISEVPIDNIKAYEYYFKSKQAMGSWTESELEQALHYLHKGLELVGENALLYSQLGYIYYQFWNLGYKIEELYLKKAADYAKKIFEIDADSLDGYFLKGTLEMAGGNIKQSIHYYQQVLNANPNHSEALAWISAWLGYIGKTAAAISFYERLMRIDPLNVMVHFLPLWFKLFEGRFDIALEPIQKLYKSNPDFMGNRWLYIMVNNYLFRLKDAFSVIDEMEKEIPNNPHTKLFRLLKFAHQGKKSRLETIDSDLERWARKDLSYAYLIAECFSLVGEREKAYDWLETAISGGMTNYPFLNEFDPFLENIRGEPRFKKLMERVKHEWEHFEV